MTRKLCAMTYIRKLLSTIPLLNELRNNRFVCNLSYMGVAQLVNRFFRLSAAIVVARMLFPEDYGIAALALTVNELLHVFVRGALINKLVQSADDEINHLCTSAYWINWVLCISLLVIQGMVALALGWWHGNAELALAIAVLGLTYLVLPFATIQAALTLRANRLAVTAQSEALQTLADSFLTILLALTGCGLWALIIPKLLAAPIWAMVYRRAHHWKPESGIRFTGGKILFDFGRHVVIGDVVITLRNNIDFLLIAHFLGMEALGIYFFAYNAGLGVTQGFINAFSVTLYSHLCNSTTAEQRSHRFKKSLISLAYVTIPIILLQAALAKFYVPFIFGEHWIETGAIPVVILICLSALSRPFAEAASQMLRASGYPKLDLIWQCLFTVILSLALVLGINWGLNGVALAILISHLLLQPGFAYWATKKTRQYTNVNEDNHVWRKQTC